MKKYHLLIVAAALSLILTLGSTYVIHIGSQHRTLEDSLNPKGRGKRRARRKSIIFERVAVDEEVANPPDNWNSATSMVEDPNESDGLNDTNYDSIEKLMAKILKMTGDSESSKLNRHSPSARLEAFWQRFVIKVPSYKHVEHLFSGTGIVMFAGGVGTFPQAIASIVYLRRYIKCPLPVELWHLQNEAGPPKKMQAFMEKLGVTVKVISGAFSRRTLNKYTYKPVCALFSSFDRVLFLDSDAVIVRDPTPTLNLLGPDNTALFWRDFWTLDKTAKIWPAVGGWPGKDEQYWPSQESGIIMICKSCGGWEPLALTTFFNVHNQIFYDAIYLGEYGRANHGAGDKDTFQIAWYALKVPFKMMRPPALIGPISDGDVCGGTIAQHDEDRNVLVCHHNANKWRYGDYASGKLMHDGMGMSHIAELKDESLANHANGIDDLTSAMIYTYQQQGIGWCVKYRVPTTIRTTTEAFGFNISAQLQASVTLTYSSVYMKEFYEENK